MFGIKRTYKMQQKQGITTKSETETLQERK